MIAHRVAMEVITGKVIVRIYTMLDKQLENAEDEYDGEIIMVGSKVVASNNEVIHCNKSISVDFSMNSAQKAFPTLKNHEDPGQFDEIDKFCNDIAASICTELIDEFSNIEITSFAGKAIGERRYGTDKCRIIFVYGFN